MAGTLLLDLSIISFAKGGYEMNFLNDGLVAFDFKLPIYNWFFPFASEPIREETRRKIGDNNFNIFNLAGGDARFRALYFHVPFCESICSFCPFSREVCTDDEIFEKYTDALVKEIRIKSSYKNVGRVPVDAIFFGGGTPSILKPSQIRRIGQAINECFDLSNLKEWSYEFFVTTVTPDRIEAVKEIGVTHARMGVQTFNPKYRALFNLSTPVEQVVASVQQLKANFKFVSFDMLYAMHGQTFEEMITDLHHAVQLDTPTIDVYPINNVVTQLKLSKEFREKNMEATSAHAKFLMNVVLNEYMRKNGYLPHNGHGYVKAAQPLIDQRPVVTDIYRFQYHEAHYGYKGHEIVGFGSGAYSITDGYMVGNVANYRKYMSDMLERGQIDMNLFEFDPTVCESKGISFHLPYHGEADKSRINFDLVRPEVLERLEKVIQRGLVVDTGTHYRLTELGWHWYGNLLYYLSPDSDQEAIRSFIQKNAVEKNRFVETCDIALQFA